jgi:hypothetical protein
VVQFDSTPEAAAGMFTTTSGRYVVKLSYESSAIPYWPNRSMHYCETLFGALSRLAFSNPASGGETGISDKKYCLLSDYLKDPERTNKRTSRKTFGYTCLVENKPQLASGKLRRNLWGVPSLRQTGGLS